MKRLISLLIAVVILCGTTGCAAGSKGNSFDIDFYKKSVADLCASIEESAVHYGNIASYQNNLWKASENMGSIMTQERLVNSGFEWFFEETGISAEDLTATYDANASTYKDIIMQETEGEEAKEIEELLRNFFASYMDLRNLVISPSGSRNDFVGKYNDIINSLTSVKSELLIFLA
jgi:hypothetical protein